MSGRRSDAKFVLTPCPGATRPVHRETFERSHRSVPLVLAHAGHQFWLGLLGDGNDSPSVGWDRWLYAPITEDERHALLMGEAPLRDLFRRPLLVVDVHGVTGAEDFFRGNGRFLSDAWLPPAGERLATRKSARPLPPALEPAPLPKEDLLTRLDALFREADMVLSEPVGLDRAPALKATLWVPPLDPDGRPRRVDRAEVNGALLDHLQWARAYLAASLAQDLASARPLALGNTVRVVREDDPAPALTHSLVAVSAEGIALRAEGGVPNAKGETPLTHYTLAEGYLLPPGGESPEAKWNRTHDLRHKHPCIHPDDLARIHLWLCAPAKGATP